MQTNATIGAVNNKQMGTVWNPKLLSEGVGTLARTSLALRSGGGPGDANCTRKQTLRKRRAKERATCHAASRLAENCHSLSVAAERSDLLLHPTQSRKHVEKTEVGGDIAAGLVPAP